MSRRHTSLRAITSVSTSGLPTSRRGIRILTAQISHELIDGEVGVRDDTPERALADLFMVRHDNAGMRSIAAEDHVAAGLPTKHETGALQSPPDFATGQAGGETRQGAYAASTSTNSLPASVGIGSPALRQSSK